MGLLLILPILVSGYLVCMNHPYYFCRLHRYDGQLLYLLVAKLGLYCVLFALIACSTATALDRFLEWCDLQGRIGLILVDLGYSSAASAAHHAFVLEVAVLTIFTPALWTLAARFLGFLRGRYTGFGSASAYHRTRLLLDTPLGELLFDSVSKTRQILMLTMNDRKVYVGLVDSLGEASEKESPQSTFSFVPMLSGYRDKDTLELKLITTYPDRDTIRIVLRAENVLTATPWKPEHWKDFSAVRAAHVRTVNRKCLRQRLLSAGRTISG